MNVKYRFFYFIPLLATLFLVLPGSAFPYEFVNEDAPVTSLEVTCGSSLLLPGVPCVLSLQANGLPPMQYAGLELHYDPDRLTFLQEWPGSAFEGEAVTIARHLPNERLGVSVSSTAGERLADGEIMYLDFVIRDGAPNGAASISVEFLEFTDRDGSSLSAPLPEAAGITIPPYLSDAGITGPGPVTIARGSDLLFGFRLDASGVTVDELADPERFMAAMAIIDAGSWDGSAPLPDQAAFDRLVPLTYTGTSGGQFRFEAPFPQEHPVGTWKVVGLFQLVDHPELVAGYSSDGGGLWDPETYPDVEVTVTTPRVTVAEFTFDGEQWTAGSGLYTNLQPDTPAEVTLFEARFSGWTTGSPGRAPNSNNWQQEDNADGSDGDGGSEGEGDGDGGTEGVGEDFDAGDGGNASPVPHDKYWQAKLSTGGYQELTLQFRMNGSGTGPRDFRLYYSTDSDGGGDGDGDGDGELNVWQPVTDGEFEVGTSWTLFTLNLPPDASDLTELLLRWVRIGNTSINGDEIGSTGTNRLDEILITGVPIETEELFVWPGNTRGDGTVAETDVLNLALYWMSTGPERVPRSIAWSPQQVVRWVPDNAAHADTDGDGRVGYRDLLAIGRNFGETVDPASPKIAVGAAALNQQDGASAHLAEDNSSDHLPPLLLKVLPVLSAQETVRIVLRSGSAVPLLGISTRFALEKLPPDAWELVEFAPGDWADEWQASDRLIRFHHGRAPQTVRKAVPADKNAQWNYDKTARGNENTQNNVWSAAWAHTGPAAPAPASELVILTIRARTDWQAVPLLHLQRASLSGPNGLNNLPDTEKWELVRQDLPVNTEREPLGTIPLTTRLHANYPNPFNPSTTLSFDLHQAVQVRLSVYDALGRRIAILNDIRMDAGRHELTWDASRYASGVYLIRMETPYTTQTRQVMLLK